MPRYNGGQWPRCFFHLSCHLLIVSLVSLHCGLWDYEEPPFFLSSSSSDYEDTKGLNGDEIDKTQQQNPYILLKTLSACQPETLVEDRPPR